MSGSAILLFDKRSGEYVDAVLHERISTEYASKVDISWRTYFEAEKGKAEMLGKPLPAMEHDHWLWRQKVDVSYHLLSCPTFAVECNGETQGVMLLKTDGYFARIPEEQGKPIVYIESLASAPWNLERVTLKPRYSGVGIALIGAAIQVSQDLEFKGRVGLNSLPQSERYYEQHQFEFISRDKDKQNLKYYELRPESAAIFMQEGS